jgi:hypothetical protein
MTLRYFFFLLLLLTTIIHGYSSFHADCLSEITSLQKDSLNRHEFMDFLSRLSSSHLGKLWTIDRLHRRFQSIFNLSACSGEHRGWLRNSMISIKSTEEQNTLCKITEQALQDLMLKNGNRSMDENQGKEDGTFQPGVAWSNICLA